jgi:hypothetical protein
LNFNHHEVIPQLPEGQHHDAKHHITAKQLHCEATSLAVRRTSLRSTLTFPSGKISLNMGGILFRNTQYSVCVLAGNCAMQCIFVF